MGRGPQILNTSHVNLFNSKTPNAAASPITALAPPLYFQSGESTRNNLKKKKIHSRAPKFSEVRIKSSQVKKRRPARGDGPGPPASPSPAPQRSTKPPVKKEKPPRGTEDPPDPAARRQGAAAAVRQRLARPAPARPGPPTAPRSCGSTAARSRPARAVSLPIWEPRAGGQRGRARRRRRGDAGGDAPRGSAGAPSRPAVPGSPARRRFRGASEFARPLPARSPSSRRSPGGGRPRSRLLRRASARPAGRRLMGPASPSPSPPRRRRRHHYRCLRLSPQAEAEAAPAAPATSLSPAPAAGTRGEAPAHCVPRWGWGRPVSAWERGRGCTCASSGRGRPGSAAPRRRQLSVAGRARSRAVPYAVGRAVAGGPQCGEPGWAADFERRGLISCGVIPRGAGHRRRDGDTPHLSFQGRTEELHRYLVR